MDCSNPVKDSSRMTIKQMMETVTLTRKQDLMYLQGLAQGAERTVFPQEEEREGGEDVRRKEWQALMALTSHEIDTSPSLSLDGFLEPVAESMPICGLLLEGMPIHPPAVANKGGKVSVALTFGGMKRVEAWYMRLLKWVEPDLLGDAMNALVYTRGEARGFEKRLREQTTRECVTCYGVSDLNLDHAPIRRNPEGARRLLRRGLQYDPTRLPDWHRDLTELFQEIETSNISSAGAPYWRKKPEVLEEMMVCVMPMIHEAISRGTLPELFQQQPELFLGQVKNKLDRYDPMKLADKCRPYFTLPFHWQALFSMLSQPFTHSLRMFYEDCSGQCANAYGFSWAHGGGHKALGWASLIRDGEARFYAYGDDVDVYYREKGKLYRVSPDFRQMDGSIDRDTVKEVVDYIIAAYTSVHGRSEFWEVVGEQWIEFATNPLFIVHGTQIWKKKSTDGLLTGVVGTTLFDTAKSVMAYGDLVDCYGHGMRHLMKERHAIEFFAQRGLEIKEGTWNPQQVLEYPTPGELVSPNKFLGISLIWAQGPERTEPVPYLEYEDWLKLLACPRDDPNERDRSGGGKGTRSTLARERLWFDRLRGYLVTGAFSNPEARRLIGGLLNMIDPVAILMRTQAGGGKGEKPEAFAVCGDDFEFPSSDGVPNVRWCENIYFSEGNKWGESEAQWQHVFPHLVGRVQEFHTKWKPMRPVMTVTDVVNVPKDRHGVLTKRNPMDDPTCTVEASMLEVGLIEPPVGFRDPPEMAPISGVKGKKINPEKAAKRSAILDVTPSEEGRAVKPKKRLPDSVEILEKLFQTAAPPVRLRAQSRLMTNPDATPVTFWEKAYRGAKEAEEENPYTGIRVWQTPVLLLEEVAQKLGTGDGHAAAICRKAGYHVLGKTTRLVTRVALKTSDPGEARKIEKQQAENETWAKVVSRQQKSVTRTVMRSKQMPAEMPEVSVQVINPLKLRPLEFMRDKPPSELFADVVTGNKLFLWWTTRQVHFKDQTPPVQLAETTLIIGDKDPCSRTEVASAVGPTSKANRDHLAEWALNNLIHGTPIAASKKAQKNSERLKRRKEETAQQDGSWAEEVLATYKVGARTVFRCRGGRLQPGEDFKIAEDLGWTTIEGAAAAPQANAPIRRGKETLSSFLLRVKKLLQSEGLQHVRFETPNSVEPPPPKIQDARKPEKAKASTPAKECSKASASQSKKQRKQ